MAIERFACLKEIKYNNHIHKHLLEDSEEICYCVYKITRASKIAFCARENTTPQARRASSPCTGEPCMEQ